MAKRKPQVRVVAGIRGEIKRLFSVREGSNGRLLISTHADGLLTWHQGEMKQTKESRHTVHPSDGSVSGAITVHKTMIFEDGSRHELHLLTHAVRDNLFQPIYVRRVPLMTGQRPLVPHAKDEIIHVGDYEPSDNGLVYCIWITSPDTGASFPRRPWYNVFSRKFRRFDLVVAFAFTRRPTPPGAGIHEYVTTSADKITPAMQAANHVPGIAVGAVVDEAAYVVTRDFNQLIRQAGPITGFSASSEMIVIEPPLFWAKPEA